MSSESAARATLLIPLLRQRDEWLEQCVRSAIAQTVPCEVIVVTSEATPASNLAVLDRSSASAPSLRVVRRPSGARFAAALNLGFREASGARVGLLLSDDWLEPDAVEHSLAIDADIVSSSATMWAGDGRTRLVDLDRLRRAASLREIPSLERRAHYLGHFLLLSRSAVLDAGGVDETVGDSPGVDDYHLLWTMLERGCTAAVCERPLYNYRDHEGERLTNRKPLDMLATMDRILAKHGLAPAEHEQLLAWHARWFGRSLQECVTHQGRSRRFQRAEDALVRVETEDHDPRIVACLDLDGAATLDQHAEALARRGVAPESTLLAAIGAAIVAGLVVPCDAAPAVVVPGRSTSGATPTTLAIVACGEPELTTRSLAQWRDQLDRHGRSCRLLVVDDSRSSADREAIAGAASGAGADYFGADHKQELARELARDAGIDPAVLAFGLSDPLGSSYTLGANLNALLLATAGEVVISVDQDIECRAYRPVPNAGVTIGRTEFREPPRWIADDAEKAPYEAECDVLGEHGAWLGRAVDAQVGGRAAVVVGSWMGVMGSVGYADATSEVLSSASHELRRDGARLAKVLEAPRGLRCPDRVTLNPGVGFTSSTIGLDNRRLLPPFLPVGRGIDLLAGLMISSCRPESLFAFLPWGLAHDRPTAQRDSTGQSSPLWYVLALFVTQLSARLRASSAEGRMRELGAGLTAAARLPDDLLRATVAKIDAQRRRELALKLRTALAETPDGCAQWRHEVAVRADRLEQDLGPLAPHDVPMLATGDGWGSMRTVIERYGALLVAWPAMLAAVRARRHSRAA